MKIKGTHTLTTDRKTLWPMLQDPEVLARISPGISRIEDIGGDKFTAISDISIGPVRGSFEGELAIIDKVDLETMTLTLKQKSKIGNAEATIVMNLADAEDGQTAVNYDGSAKLSGTLASMGQRIMGGVVKTLTKQVFSELGKIIKERSVEAELNAAFTKVEEETPVTDKLEKIGDTVGSKLEEESTGLITSIIDKLKSIWKSLLG